MKKLEADVVVVGGGTAGMPAVVQAAEGGASVILFEALGSTGGTGNRGNMITGIGSKSQLEKPEQALTSMEAFKTHMEYTHWHGDPRLVKAFYDLSGSTIDWLKDMGVKFHDPSLFPGGMGRPGAASRPAVTFIVDGIPPGPKQVGQVAVAMRILTKRARELGVQIYLKTRATRLIKRGGRIVGVVARDRDGQECRARAKAVIVGTGGFSGNKEWVKKYTGYDEGKDLYSFKLGSLQGDGIRMAWEVGAVPTQMKHQLMCHIPFPYHGPGGTANGLNAFQQPNLMVNLMGERFFSEDQQGGRYLAIALDRQKGKCGINIFDGDTKRYFYEEGGLVFPSGPAAAYQVFKSNDDLDANIRETWSKGYKHLFMADTLEELCAQSGINLEGLKKTVAEYNQLCENGYDAHFGKDPKYLRPVKSPKFYGAKFFSGSYGTVGGIRINHKTEVIDNNYEVIPGLYATGADANDIYGDNYAPFGGNYMSFAFNTGRMAAINALEYIKTV